MIEKEKGKFPSQLQLNPKGTLELKEHIWQDLLMTIKSKKNHPIKIMLIQLHYLGHIEL